MPDATSGASPSAASPDSTVAPTVQPGKVQRSRLYEQIVESLLAHIRANRLRVGDRLPAERELAASLGVSRASLAQALVALEVLGVISVRHGEGARIVRDPQQDNLIAGLRAHQDSITDIIDARSAMETKLAALAAHRRTEVDLAAIDRALEQMAAQIDRGERGLPGDQAFHEAVTAAGHAPVLARLMAEISSLVAETRLESLSQPGRPRRSLEGHWQIAAAIRDRDSEAAAAAMADHIELVSDVALLRPDA